MTSTLTRPLTGHEPTQYCTFEVGGLQFGVDVQTVQEVVHRHELTPVPGAPDGVEGLINVRGHIVTAVDLRRRLGMPPRADGDQPMHVMIHSRGEIVSLLVDAIGEVLDVGDRVLEPRPSTLRAPLSALVPGVLPLDDSILLILDADRAVDAACSSPLEGTS